MSEVQKHAFSSKEELPLSRRIASKIWRIFPISVASLEGLCFGLMLGWPSPVYPQLLAKDTPVPILLDQTAMVAGFLMFGICFSTPFSRWSPVGIKYGLVSSLILILVGWLLMWQATSVYWLIGSRMLIGLGHGYGVGQLKVYIKEMSSGKNTRTFTKLINMYILFGVIVVYCVGPFVTFKNLSVICIGINAIVLFLCILLPHPPRELVKFTKDKQASIVLQYLEPQRDPLLQIKRIKEEENLTEKDISTINIFKDGLLRRKTLIVLILTFFQQYTGIPPTLVYTQIIFREFGYTYPELLAILYVLVYAMMFIFFLFKMETMDSKYLLLFSSTLVTIALWLQVLILYFNFNHQYFHYSSLFIMLFYEFVHSLGLGVVPFKAVSEYFTPEARTSVGNCQIMCHSFFALTSTKIFQVLYGTFGLQASFVFHGVISVFAVFFILVFVPKESEEKR